MTIRSNETSGPSLNGPSPHEAAASSLGSATGWKEGKGGSRRGLATSISVLFIVQLLTAAIGNSFIQSFSDGDADKAALTIGVVLMMFSGVVIAAIGVLLYRVLKFANKSLALWVPVLRSTECVVAIIFGIYLLTNLHVVPNHLLWVYILAGAAGVVLSYLLFISRLVPRPIATLGLVGYSLLLLGVPLDFAGLIDMNEGVGQSLFIPGGLFELVFLPIWLIAKGFNSPAATLPEQKGQHS